MNRIISRLLRAGAMAGVVSLLTAQGSGLALQVSPGGAKAAVPASDKSSPFCNDLSTYSDSINSKFSLLTGKVSQAWTAQDQKLSAISSSLDQKVTGGRLAADAELKTDFAKLQAKAKTGTQLQAVQTYETAVNSAVNTRRAAYDAARAAFRVGVTSAITGRRNAVKGQMNSFQTSVASAVSTAQASCANNAANGRSTGATFVKSLKSARQTFKSERSGDDKIKQQVQKLAATRDVAFRAADKTFQSSLRTARQTLDQAFKTSV